MEVLSFAWLEPGLRRARSGIPCASRSVLHPAGVVATFGVREGRRILDAARAAGPVGIVVTVDGKAAGYPDRPTAVARVRFTKPELA